MANGDRLGGGGGGGGTGSSQRSLNLDGGEERGTAVREVTADRGLMGGGGECGRGEE